jgi:hypothetical protein
MTKHLFILLALFVSGCKNLPKEEASEHNPHRIMNTIPAEYQLDVVKAEMFGAEIYSQDVAAWVVTDFLISKGVVDNDKRLRGWVTEHVETDDESMLVSFIGEVSGEHKILYQVEAKSTVVLNETYKEFPSGIALSKTQLGMFNARQTALSSQFMRCSNRYNTAVLRFEDEVNSYNLVYLLPASSKVGEVALGGNHRVTVNNDGDKIVENFPLSKSCLTMQKRDDVEALTISHIVEPTPNAVHVFLSMLHRTPIYVLTTENKIIWKVDGNKISLLDIKKT